MRGKLTGFLLGTSMLAAISAVSAYAAGWTTNSNGEQIYQNDNGSTVTNSWIKADNNGTTIWYYATNTGTLRKDGWQKIGDYYYYFNDQGIMQTGWVDNDNYYCDTTSGAMKTGWKQLPLPEDVDDDDYNKGDSYWFYFNTRTGEKYKSDDEEAVSRTIDNVTYGFDENGVMVTGWAKTDSKQDSELGNYSYFAEKTDSKYKLGERINNTWYSTVGPDDDNNSGNSSDLATGDVEWFYFKRNGHPVAGTSDVYKVEKIDSKRYLFNEKGNPAYGIVLGSTSTNTSDADYYYCGTSRNDCSVKTGKMTVEDGDGEKITCYFDSTGKGYTGVKDDYLYYKGKLQKADSDLDYQLCTVNGKQYVVNESGRVMKSRSNVKDGNGNKVSTNSDGTLKANVSGSLESFAPEAPVLWDTDD
ncbi:MAG: cell wall-binding protein [Oribacterium sp.]|nr:cell wall-binding protein [Oribacterium sp.]